MKVTIFSQKTCSGKAGSLVGEQVREGKEATSGCKDRRSHGGSLGRPRRCPAASPLAPMPLRSPRGTVQVTPQSVPVGGNRSTCFPRPIGHWRELLGWAVDKIPRGCGPPRRQGRGSRGREADTEVRALAAGIGCAVGARAHIQ